MMLFEETFESLAIDPSKWYLCQAHEPVVRTSGARSGIGVLALTGRPEMGCGGIVQRDGCPAPEDSQNCFRNEVRAPAHEAGGSIWYGFSLKTEGKIARTGSIRTIVAQWKEDGGASPFVALRYDNGVLYTTIQDNNCRRLMTLGEGEAEAVFDFLNDQRPYNCTTTVEIRPSELLPDPFEQWIDFALEIRRDRNQGLVRIYANGLLAGEASGPIGSDWWQRHPVEPIPEGGDKPFVYMKLGLYGDLCSHKHKNLRDNNVAICRVGEMTVLFDNVRIGFDRETVDPSHASPRAAAFPH